jgi:hypothetical protein
VAQRVDRGMGGALGVDAQLRVGQGIKPVGVGPVLADSTCGRNWSSSGGTIAWNARSQLASPVRAGSATLTADPFAPGPPDSAGRPV